MEFQYTYASLLTHLPILSLPLSPLISARVKASFILDLVTHVALSE